MPQNHLLTRATRWLPALVLAALTLSGCSAMQAQNPSSAIKPVNATPMQNEDSLMLKGHDVVAFFTQNKHAMGSAQFKSVYEGVAFWFASAEHKALFDAAPQKYLPQYGGFCANGIVYGIPWGGDADTWLKVGDKLYIFGGTGSRAAFLLDVPANTALADKYWAEEVKGNNSFVQRTKRLVLRVPHYKNGEELDKMVKEAAAKKS
jgi:YHS domain-containing protein